MATFDAETRRRALLAYALASRGVSASQDIYNALTPFFRPLLFEIGDRVIDPGFLRHRVSILYGWNTSLEVIEEVLPRLETLGWIKAVFRNNEVVGYQRVSAEFDTITTDDKQLLENLNNIVARFQQFHKTLPALGKSKLKISDYESILLQWIVSTDTVGKSALDVPPSDTDGQRDNYQSQVAYLCARFVSSLQSSDPELFDVLEEICSVALLTEVVADFGAPPDRDRKEPGLLVFLDGPFLMSALGLSGAARKENADFILQGLARMEIQLAAMPHSCDEVHDVVDAVVDKPMYEVTGLVADALRKNEVDPGYARLVRDDPKYSIENIGIKYDIYSNRIRDLDDYTFPTKLIDEFKLKLSGWGSETAKERDALSIARIMRIRKGTGTIDAFSTKAILVSRNPVLCSAAKKFCVATNLARSEWVGPAITQRQLAGLIWITLGDNIEERRTLSRRYLLSSCQNVLRSNPEVVADIRSIARGLGEARQEQVDALLMRPRSAQALSDVTLSQEHVLTGENFEEVITAMEQSLIAEHEVKKELEIDGIRDAHDREKGELEKNLRESKERLTSTEVDLKVIRERDRIIVKEAVIRAKGHGASIRKIIKWLGTGVVVGLSVLTFGIIWAKLGLGKSIIATLIVVVLQGIFLLLPVWQREANTWFDRWVRSKEREFLESALVLQHRHDLVLNVEELLSGRSSEKLR